MTYRKRKQETRIQHNRAKCLIDVPAGCSTGTAIIVFGLIYFFFTVIRRNMNWASLIICSISIMLFGVYVYASHLIQLQDVEDYQEQLRRIAGQTGEKVGSLP